MNSIQKGYIFDQGYACAIACIVKSHGGGTEAKEALKANGMTSVEKLKKSRIDSYDIEVLTPLIREIEADEAYRARRLSKEKADAVTTMEHRHQFNLWITEGVEMERCDCGVYQGRQGRTRSRSTKQ